MGEDPGLLVSDPATVGLFLPGAGGSCRPSPRPPWNEVSRAVYQRLDSEWEWGPCVLVLMCWCLLVLHGVWIFPFLAGPPAPSLALPPGLPLSACLYLSSCVS